LVLLAMVHRKKEVPSEQGLEDYIDSTYIDRCIALVTGQEQWVDDVQCSSINISIDTE